MFIRIQLPNQYSDVQTIKEENYPFKHAFHEYMRAIIDVANHYQFTAYEVFGKIEHELCQGTPLILSNKEGSPVSIDYREDDDKIIQFYKSTAMTNKHVTLLFIRLMLRLAQKYGGSIAEMVYMIHQLEQSASPESRVEREDNSQELPAPLPQASDEPLDPDSVVKMVKVRKNTSSKMDESLSPKTKVSPNPVIESSQTDDRSSDILKEAVKLKDTTEKILKQGVTIEQNPVLGDFFDLASESED